MASFLSSPSLIARIASILPLSLLKPNPISKWLLHLIGFNLKGNKGLVNAVFKSLSKANKDKLKQRLKNIAKLNTPKNVHDLPAVYIKPSSDRLVSKQSVNTLQSVFVNCQLITLEGGHFIGQSNPAGCAEIVTRAVALTK